MKVKKILFTVAYLDGLHGSVMHVAELSSYLVNQGWDVTVASIYIDRDKIRNLFDGGVVLEIVLNIENERFDVIWAYHFPLVGALFAKGVSCDRLVFGSLSCSEKLEIPPIFWKSCSVLHAVSWECASRLSKNYSIPLNAFTVMENLLPKNFVDFSKSPKTDLKRIVVVSNHPPEEIKRLPHYFRDDGVYVEFVGGRNSRLVTPDLLAEFDVVVTIGKTVQYSMGLGIPVYIYDRFGGNGYVTTLNFEREKRYNFSGRPDCRKLSAGEIYKEISENYISAAKEAVCLRDIAVRDFLLCEKVDLMLKKIETSPAFAFEEISQYELYNDQCLEVCSRLHIERLKRKKVKKECLLSLKSFLKKMVGMK